MRASFIWLLVWSEVSESQSRRPGPRLQASGLGRTWCVLGSQWRSDRLTCARIHVQANLHPKHPSQCALQAPSDHHLETTMALHSHVSAFPIPIDVVSLMINHLAADDEPHFTSLKACALVCQSFLPLCQERIFSSIKIGLDGEGFLEEDYPDSEQIGFKPTASHFVTLIMNSPGLATYIRRLEFGYTTKDLQLENLSEALKKIDRLQSLKIAHFPTYVQNPLGTNPMDWVSMPLRSAFQYLLRLPFLTEFSIIWGITGFPVSDIALCKNLRRLHIFAVELGAIDVPPFPGSATTNKPLQLEEYHVWGGGLRGGNESKNTAKLLAAKHSNGQSVVDFSTVKRVLVKVMQKGEVTVLKSLFMRFQELTALDLRSECNSTGI